MRNVFRLTCCCAATALTRRLGATGTRPTIWIRGVTRTPAPRAPCPPTHDRSVSGTSPVESGCMHAGDVMAKRRRRRCGAYAGGSSSSRSAGQGPTPARRGPTSATVATTDGVAAHPGASTVWGLGAAVPQTTAIDHWPSLRVEFAPESASLPLLMMNESPGVTYKCTARVEMTAASVNRLAHVITLAQVCPVGGS